jgi:hypothetical protein
LLKVSQALGVVLPRASGTSRTLARITKSYPAEASDLFPELHGVDLDVDVSAAAV